MAHTIMQSSNMRVYHLTQTVLTKRVSGVQIPILDTYDSCVVIAVTESQAKNISIDDLQGNSSSEKWPSIPALIKATLIGYALSEGSEAKVVCSSFNAG